MNRVGFYTATVAALVLIVWLTFFNKKTQAANAIINTADAPKPIGPCNQAVLRGNALFVSGQIALDPKTGTMDTADITQETKRVMQNVSAILSAAKMTTANIAKTTICVTDLHNFQTVNDAYASFFTNGNFPARETVQVVALPKNAHVEISVMAIK